MSAPPTTQRLLITGRVQGVGYRDWLVREARRLALAGWVRNRGDGSVEAVAGGDAAAMAALVERSRQGPPLARVDEVAVTAAAESDLPDRFERRPTA